MKTTQKILLKVIKPIQNQPIPLDAIARRTHFCVRTINHHLRELERAKLVAVDRSGRPHAYELTAAGYVALQFAELRDQQLFFSLNGGQARHPAPGEQTGPAARQGGSASTLPQGA